MLAEVWVPSHVYEAIDGSVGWGKGEVDVQQIPSHNEQIDDRGSEASGDLSERDH